MASFEGGHGAEGHGPRQDRGTCERDRGVRRVFTNVETAMPMTNLRQGHAPCHLRHEFLEAVDGFLQGWRDTSELDRVCKLLWNCTDVLPGRTHRELRDDAGLMFRRHTYAAAARAIQRTLKRGGCGRGSRSRSAVDIAIGCPRRTPALLGRRTLDRSLRVVSGALSFTDGCLAGADRGF